MSVPKLRFKEFDENWNVEVLGNIVQIKSGYSPSKYELHENGEIPFLKVEELNNSNKYQEYSRFYTETCADVIPKKSVIFPKRGAAILNNKVRILKVDSLLDSNLMALIPQNTLDAEYLYYLINKVELYRIADTSTIPQINNKHIEPYEIHLPSKAEQTKVASFLSAVDEKISQLTQKHQLLSQYKQGMMQKLFSQQIRFKADDGSEFGEWEEIKLTDFLKFTPRPIEKPNTNYHALGVRSHFKGLFNKFDSEPNKISMDTLYRVKRNDVVVNITFAWEGAMAIAEKEHDEGLVSHRFPTYLCDDSKINLHFFKYRFIQKDFLSALQLCSPGGAGRNRVLNKSAFLEISFSKPTLEEQTKIANFLSSIDQKIVVVAQQIEQAKTWKKGLLQQMFV